MATNIITGRNEKKTEEEIMDKYLNVLVIEDDEDDAFLVKKMLHNNEEGVTFSVTHKNRLSKGLNYLEKNLVDVILLDLSLPDSNGDETIKEVQEKSSNKVPIVVLTGSTLSRDELRTCINDADAYLIKNDIDSDSLVKSILQVKELH